VRRFVIYTALFLAACSQGGQTPEEPSQDIAVTRGDSAVKARYIEGVEAYNRGNFETAYLQLTQFANDGVPLAQTLVGTMLCLGQGVSPDCSQGARYIKLGAYQGFGPAQFQLGTLHHKALGVPYDPVEAFVWYSLAAENPTSDYELRGKATSGKQELERQLSSEQLSHANWILRDPRLLDDPTLDLTGHQQDDKDRLTHILRELEKGSEPSTQASIQSPKYGHTGPQTELVKDVQAYLSALGYKPGPIDGKLGRKTKAAIKAFQKDEGLTIDGEPSDELLGHLRNPTKVIGKSRTATKGPSGGTGLTGESAGRSSGSGSSTVTSGGSRMWVTYIHFCTTDSGCVKGTTPGKFISKAECEFNGQELIWEAQSLGMIVKDVHCVRR
jgi:hypothetical protein